MSQTPERRISSIEFDLRASKDSGDEKVIQGLAARYNVLSGPIPGGRTGTFRERLMPGVFAKVLASKPDVVMLQDHDPSKILGRTTAGTLQLADAAKGLQFRCIMPNTQLGNDLHESIKRGDINSCSFSFNCGEARGDEQYDEFDEDDFDEEGEQKKQRSAKSGKKIIVRSVRNISRLHDVSVVTYPAYPRGTSVSARSAAIFVPTPREVIQANIHRLETELENDSVRQRRKDLLRLVLS